MKKIFSLVFSIFLLPAILFVSGCGKTPDDPTNPEIPPLDNDAVYEMSADGKYVYFGMYPQTIKADDVTISPTPEQDGYYLGSDGAKYFKHTMVNLGVYWPNGLSEDEMYDLGLLDTSDGQTMQVGQEYYFKMEKLKWRILKQENGTALIVCDSAIYSMPYQINYEEDVMGDCGWYVTDGSGNWIYDEDGETKIYGNNYKYSQLRSFLINDFYNTAFSTIEKEIINLTEVDNSATSTGKAPNSYICANTNDYVFALSYADLINEEYGFNTNAKVDDLARRWYNTDFAKATGAFSYTSLYIINKLGVEIDSESYDIYEPYFDTAKLWLRSPCDCYEFDVIEVNCGYSYTSSAVHTLGNSVVPALKIRLAD